jgi:hypothetical protein
VNLEFVENVASPDLLFAVNHGCKTGKLIKVA